MDKGKLLYIVSGDLWGGAETQVLSQVKALLTAGWSVTVLLFNHGQTENKYREAGFNVEVIEEQKGLVNLFRQAALLVKRLNVHIIIAHGYKENFLACALKVMGGVTVFDYIHGATECYHGVAAVKMFCNQLINRLLCRFFAGQVIVVSQKLADKLDLTSWSKTVVINNIVNLSANKDALGCANPVTKHPAVVIVGRLAPVKRVDLAIAAMAELKNKQGRIVQLYIVGTGPLAEELKKQAVHDKVGQEVAFLGFRDDVGAILSAADIYLICSDSEGMPTALLEAISWGRPVVATDVGGVSEILQYFPDYPAALVSADNAAKLANAIGAMLDQAAHYDRHRAGQIIAQNFSGDSFVEAIEPLLIPRSVRTISKSGRSSE